MKTRTRRSPAALLAVVLALAATACGGDGGAEATATATGNPTDRAFVAAMVPHHEAAVEMAEVARTEATGAYVKALASSIARTQAAEIAELRRVDAALARDGVERGDLEMDERAMGMEMDAGMLRGATPFDPKFLEMMIPHHEGAIEMAKVELARGASPDLKRLAQSIVSTQRREVEEMRAQLAG